ncbi:hypothetical protein [Pseudomonas sp.]|uniref:hypothetical protein n=1 Tax=Pseudomonas sp. TaxID=306 RepID=UPI003D0E937D
MIAEAFNAIGNLMQVWTNSKENARLDRQRRCDAIKLVKSAVVATKSYMHDIEKGISPSREVEKDLSQKWVDASMAIIDYDHELYEVAKIKSLGWADPKDWALAASRPWAIKLNTIIDQCEYLLKRG